MSKNKVKIALLQDQCYPTMDDAEKNCMARIREAAANGANIICTQELFLTEYFCWKQ